MLTIWRFTDGKRGHDNQSLGLVEALCRLAPCHVETLKASGGWMNVFNWILGRFPVGGQTPKPDLIIGAGHATHWPMLAAHRAHGGKIAVLMKPSLPMSWFDWVITPAHDGLPENKTSLVTQGPINRIQTGSEKDRRKGLMLIGGPSTEYGWSESALLKQIHLIALHDSDILWQLTTSRRTPEGFLKNIARLELANVKAVAHDEVPADWLPDQLAHASQVWVTPDSASMVYEALTAGAAVGCLEMPFAKPKRVARGLEKLIRDRLVNSFTEWQQSGMLTTSSQSLNEAERIARKILQCLNHGN